MSHPKAPQGRTQDALRDQGAIHSSSASAERDLLPQRGNSWEDELAQHPSVPEPDQGPRGSITTLVEQSSTSRATLGRDIKDTATEKCLKTEKCLSMAHSAGFHLEGTLLDHRFSRTFPPPSTEDASGSWLTKPARSESTVSSSA